MADNYLITGYWGEPHVTAENDRGINAAIFGTGRFVLPVGEQFRAEYIGNNTVRVYDGKLVDNGAVGGIPAGRYVDLTISEAGQGMNRNDLIVFQYTKDTSTLVESGAFVVVKGTETSGTATDPALTQADLLTDEATFDQMALWRVPVSTATISDPVQVFTVLDNVQKLHTSVNAKAPRYHASALTTYGVATTGMYGHAKAGFITPKAPGTATVGSKEDTFAREDHVHPAQITIRGVKTAGSGSAYTATVEDIYPLETGVSFIMIPHTTSTSTAPTLNVNGLGAKVIRRNLSDNNTTTVASELADWLGANKPVRVTYNGTYWIADLPRPKSNDLYGTVPIEKGGHGGETLAEAQTNLGIIPPEELLNLYVWKKHEGDPSTYMEEAVTNVLLRVSLYISYTGSTATWTIRHGSSFTYDLESKKFTLEVDGHVTAPTADEMEVMLGKYIRYDTDDEYLYYIPEDATFTDIRTTSDTRSVEISKATKLKFPECFGYAAAKADDTYPENGEHTDGYWYVYHKQLGD